jgi:DNA-binding GntR family transcriptional regulator
MPDTPQVDVSKSERAYSVLKARILDGSYGPGHRIVLGQLAKELSVSAVPVREAVRRLEAEGYVDFVRNVGAQVVGIDAGEYAHAMQTLAILEGAATALAATHLSEHELAAATELNERMKASLRDFDPVSFTARNHEFHELLCGRCPNPQLRDLVHKAWSRLALIRRTTFSLVPGRAARSVAEHEQLLTLIRDGAPAEEIEMCARRHKLATLDAFLASGRGVFPQV